MPRNKKRVLIIGGGGFIGTNIARKLLSAEGYHVTVADRAFPRCLQSADSQPIPTSNLRIIEGDFSEAPAYNSLDKSYDHVYMMAAVVGVNQTLKNPETVIRVNTGLIHHSLQWLSRADIGRIVFASSSENYAAATDIFNYAIPTPETVPLTVGDVKHPRWTYAITKILGESAYLHTGPKAGFEATIVRYQNIFGPDMGFRHAIPHIVQRFHEGHNPFLIYGADQTRAFSYISDAVNGTIRAMETPTAAGEIYHIGADVEITLRTLTMAIGDIMGYEGDYQDAPTYPGSVNRRCPDITKACKQLGYAPAISWQVGLQKTVEWYKSYFKSGAVTTTAGFQPPEMFTH